MSSEASIDLAVGGFGFGFAGQRSQRQEAAMDTEDKFKPQTFGADWRVGRLQYRPETGDYVDPDGSVFLKNLSGTFTMVTAGDPAAAGIKTPTQVGSLPDCGHGHVHPNPAGIKARCGGPGLCALCSSDHAAKTKAEYAAAVRVAGGGPVDTPPKPALSMAPTAPPQARNSHLVVLKVMPGEPCRIVGPSFDARCVKATITRGGQISYDAEYWLDGKLTTVTLFDDEIEAAS